MIDQRDADAIEWSQTASQDGIRIGRAGSDVVVEWRGLGRLVCSVAGGAVDFRAAEGVDPCLLEKFTATSLMACRRYLNGALSLHASAVAVSCGAVAFVGDSGAGKSTTAMAFVERSRGTFLADDIVPIDWHGSTPVVPPVDDSFWLAADACRWFRLPADPSGGKAAHRPRARSAVTEPLRAIVHLVFDDRTPGEVSLERVTGSDAFMVLSSSQVCYSTGADAEAMQNFALRARLATAIPIFRIRRTRAFSLLPQIADLLLNRLTSDGAA